MSNYNLLGWKWGDSLSGTDGGMVEWSFTTFVLEAPYDFLDPAPEFKAEIRQAFERWEEAGEIDFEEVGDSLASDIRVGFAVLDGPGGTSAEATWFLTDTLPAQPTHVAIAFDNDEHWIWDGGVITYDGGTPFYSIALHEIGHAIGLDHFDAEPAIMNSQIPSFVAELTNSELAAVEALYGSPGGSNVADVPGVTTAMENLDMSWTTEPIAPAVFQPPSVFQLFTGAAWDLTEGSGLNYYSTLGPSMPDLQPFLWTSPAPIVQSWDAWNWV